MASLVSSNPLTLVKRNAVIVENNNNKIEHEIKTTRTTVLVDNTEVASARCKRRINFYGGMQPASVARRNARERNRVKQVNNGFATLRSHIPVSVAAALGASTNTGRGASKKLSKVETLRLAVEYIRSLQDLLDESGGPSENYFKEEKVELSPISCSEGSSSSPPPSSVCYTPEPYPPSHPPGALTPAPYTDNYEPMSPEDEELLDVISWWQQSQ